jgi:hypothetical protein
VYYDSTYEPRTYYPALLTSSLTGLLLAAACPAQKARGRPLPDVPHEGCAGANIGVFRNVITCILRQATKPLPWKTIFR